MGRRILIIGGTRNLGHLLALDLLESGAEVSVLNRGLTPNALPPDVHRLRADRSVPSELRDTLAPARFDAVVDTTLYNGPDARVIAELLRDRVERYVFLSTGQVYLVTRDAPRPSREEDYDRPLVSEPAPGTPDHDGWRYGVEKRDAEDALHAAFAATGFPYVSLRLPMVNGERDHYDRIRNYLARLDDGGPILVPDAPALPLRHVYSGDVVHAIRLVLDGAGCTGRAYNISQPETLSLDEFLGLLASLAGRQARVLALPRAELEARGLLPHCSPFSGRWMSALDDRRGIAELGMRYTPLAEYLGRIVAHHRANGSPVPTGYATRAVELEIAKGQRSAIETL
jgi:nucleoside-diphosphate-sugar epimerase